MTLIEYPLIQIPNQPSELYYGNREYKIYLDSNDNLNDNLNDNSNDNLNDNSNNTIKDSILEKKATQMLFRIYEGNGVAKYIIGIKDNGEAIGINKNKLYASLVNLQKIINIIDANLKKIRFYTGTTGYIFVAHVYKNIDYFDLNI